MNKNLSRRTFVAAGAVAAGAAALGLTACGGGEKKTEKNTTLTGGFSHNTSDFNPVGASSALGLPAAVHVYEGLFNFDYSDYSTYAALAADEPKEISPTEYEVTLREGAQYSDGRAVTTADVVNAYQQNMAEGALYLPFLSFIESVSAKDDKTVTFKLKTPSNLLKNRMAMILIFPMDSTKDQLKAGGIGSGPWKFDSVNGDEGGKIEFSPNPNYNGPKKAKADKMEWSVLVDNTARATAMKEGTIMTMEDVPAADADGIKASGAELTTLDSYNNLFFMFNTTKAPFNDARVRQAFYYALDVDAIIKNQCAGQGSAASCFLPKSAKNYHQAKTVYTHDVEKAKALLKEAGQENLSCTLLVNQNWVKEYGPQVKECLAAAGITAELDIKAIPWSSMTTDAAKAGELPYDVCLTSGDASCFGTDADAVMTWWYDNDAWMLGRTGFQFSDKATCTKIRTLMNDARGVSGDAQQAIWNECFDLIAENAVIYPFLFKQMTTAINTKKITGFKGVATTGMYFTDAAPAGK